MERITRLQQPLQYEREYIAETRFTGETPVAEVIACQVPGLPLGSLLARAMLSGQDLPSKAVSTEPWVLLCTKGAPLQ